MKEYTYKIDGTTYSATNIKTILLITKKDGNKLGLKKRRERHLIIINLTDTYMESLNKDLAKISNRVVNKEKFNKLHGLVKKIKDK